MIGTVDTATGAFRRVHHQTEDGGENVTVVKGPMRNFGSQGDMLQPTIAIITVHYFEKMAVDAMMTNKQTFVRYATVGKEIFCIIIRCSSFCLNKCCMKTCFSNNLYYICKIPYFLFL